MSVNMFFKSKNIQNFKDISMEHLDLLVCVYWKIQSDFIFKLSGGIVMSQAKSILQAQPKHSLLEVIEDSYFIQYSSGGSISNSHQRGVSCLCTIS